MSHHLFILMPDGRTPLGVDDVRTWGAWFEQCGMMRHVDGSPTEHGDVRVSTVFLGIDHSFGLGPPLLWETMIFGGAHDDYCERYASYAEAVKGHEAACALAFGNLPRRGIRLEGA